MPTIIEEAQASEAEQIAALVNHAYRPGADSKGWTHEAELVLGPRTSAEQVRDLFKQNSTVLVMREKDRVLACVHIERTSDACYIGMLATSPLIQSNGVGKQMLAATESLASSKYAAPLLKMSVLSSRPELLAYYTRRGYVLTGGITPYPIHASVGTPVRDELHVLELHKQAVVLSRAVVQS